MSGEHASPSSWRDVYDLVRDTRTDVLAAVALVDGKVTVLGGRVDDIEADRRDEKVARETSEGIATQRNKTLLRVIAASRGGIALVISAIAILIAAAK